MVFSSDDDSSAVCMYPLRAINQRLVEIIGACYSTKGQINNKSAVYSPYSSKSDELCKIENEVCTLTSTSSQGQSYCMSSGKRSENVTGVSF